MSAPGTSTRPEDRVTTSGIFIKPLYRVDDTSGEPEPDPGQFPFTRGVYRDMYRGRLWTMRQYAGFSSAEETNARFKLLLDRGQTGLSCAFDLPTQLGLDADDARAEAEVGIVGVSISTLDDMRRLLDGIELNAVTTSMTINAPASILMLMYQIVGEEQGANLSKLGGTIQNDILKEYAARGTYIFPPRASMRLVTDTFRYCAETLPSWNTISISGYHMREAGSSAVQEVAFTLANGIAYVEAALAAGLTIDQFAPRLSFFFNAHSNFLEEVAKFRAARRMWANLARDRFGARDPRSMMMRFHTQTGGSTLTAQQPLNNIVRVALQGLSAVMGGAQSLHTNGYDEALSLPTAEAATLALRTQQIIAYESGVADIADPLAGSYAVEALTDEIERRALVLIDEIEKAGGAVVAVERGIIQDAIAESAFDWERAVESGERRIVGVNFQRDEHETPVPIHHVDGRRVRRQIERTRVYREERASAQRVDALSAVAEAARGTDNLLPLMRDALLAGATLGQICDALRAEWGEYRPGY
ncbi:MAG TPA: methylmalonyl-CoA mutase family protein [Thermomicrobiales bacterium]|nr:methylmalonyl-CoA mutase family protein [Thermomicrobiales bacterium]